MTLDLAQEAPNGSSAERTGKALGKADCPAPLRVATSGAPIPIGNGAPEGEVDHDVPPFSGPTGRPDRDREDRPRHHVR